MNELERRIRLKREIIQANRDPEVDRKIHCSKQGKDKDLEDLERVSIRIGNLLEIELLRKSEILISFNKGMDAKKLSDILSEEIKTS